MRSWQLLGGSRVKAGARNYKWYSDGYGALTWSQVHNYFLIFNVILEMIDLLS